MAKKAKAKKKGLGNLFNYMLMGAGGALAGQDYLGQYLQRQQQTKRDESERDFEKWKLMRALYSDYRSDLLASGEAPDSIASYEDFKSLYDDMEDVQDFSAEEKAELWKKDPEIYRGIYGGDWDAKTAKTSPASITPQAVQSQQLPQPAGSSQPLNFMGKLQQEAQRQVQQGGQMVGQGLRGGQQELQRQGQFYSQPNRAGRFMQGAGGLMNPKTALQFYMDKLSKKTRAEAEELYDEWQKEKGKK